jgi:predicted kinase
MTGLPCTGKSSVAGALAQSLPAALLSADPIDSTLIAAGVSERPDIVG